MLSLVFYIFQKAKLAMRPRAYNFLLPLLQMVVKVARNGRYSSQKFIFANPRNTTSGILNFTEANSDFVE